ncbi:MAG: GlcG/HbpS family heme-binding protein [Acetobacteraceae bacterium]
MGRWIFAAITAGAVLIPAAWSMPAPAQPLPPGIPAVMPFAIPYGAPITLALAKKVAAAALARASGLRWKDAIAVVDPSGELVYFERMDDTQIASVAIAQDKAKAAARYRRSTKVFQDLVDKGFPYLMTLRGVVASEGGLPLVRDGKLIGAIGVSGGTSPQDGLIAAAGVAALQ